MTPTRPTTLLALVAGFVVLGYLLATAAYGSLPTLPLLAALFVVVLALVELGLAKVVRDRLLRKRTGGRPVHPMQVARAEVLDPEGRRLGVLTPSALHAAVRPTA